MHWRVKCCSVQQPEQIDVAGWAISVFFWSELAAGRRAWNAVCSAEWSSKGDLSRKQKGLFRGNIFAR